MHIDLLVMDVGLLGGIGALKPFAVEVLGGGFGSCWGGRGIVVYSGAERE